MARKIDPRKTAKALRRIERAIKAAENPEGRSLDDWEAMFAQSVTERLNTYGSAFADPAKGDPDEALSVAQAAIVRRIGKPRKSPATSSAPRRSTFGRKKTPPGGGRSSGPNVRDINDP